MGCTSPLDGWLSRERSQRGKRTVVFSKDVGYSDRPVTVPCGRCIGCRLEYARQWAMRCMHEASMFDDNSFITLTYDDEHLPHGGSLVKSDVQKFLKRLRSRCGQFRYFMCGEYGDSTLRPHYHGLLFGFDFPDKVNWSDRQGYQVYQSRLLEEVWSKGLTEIGSVSFDSAAYCASYQVKKFRGKKEDVEKFYGGSEPPFALMSRRPGLGKMWYDKYGEGVREHDSIIVNGREVRPPKYYDALFEAASPSGLVCTKARRKLAREKFVEKDGRGDSRLYAEQEIMSDKQSMLGVKSL